MAIDFVPDDETQGGKIDFVEDNPYKASADHAHSFLRSLLPSVIPQTEHALANGGMASLMGATHLGGNLIGDVGTGLSYAGYPNAGKSLQDLGARSANTTPQDFGIENPGMGTSFLSKATQAAPYMAAIPERLGLSALTKLPAALRAGANTALQGGAYGATQGEQGHAIRDALEDAGIWGGTSAGTVMLPKAIGAGISGVKSGAKAVGSKLDNLFNNAKTNSELKDLYDQISGKLTPEELNEKNMGIIKNNYNNKSDIAKSLYDNIRDEAINRGYASGSRAGNSGRMYTDNNMRDEDINKLFSSGSRLGNSGKIDTDNQLLGAPSSQANEFEHVSPNQNKYINPSDNTSASLNELFKDEHFRNISGDLKKNIFDYQNNPTYENAHKLQSSLGTESADIRNSKNSTINEKNTAKEINNARDSLIKDIPRNFTENGDKDLADSYQNARNNWRENIIPYQNIPGVWRAIRNLGDTPSNMAKVLLKDNTSRNGAYKVLRSHVSENPEDSNSFLAQMLQKGTKSNPYAEGSRDIDPQKLFATYNEIPKYFKSMSPSDTHENILNLMKSNKGYQKSVGNLKKIAKAGAGKIALGGVVGKYIL